YAAEDATPGLHERGRGTSSGAGGTQRLPRLVGLGRARDLILTGRWVAAPEALEIGLVDAVFPPEEVLPAALERARAFAEGPTRAYGAAKRALLASSGEPEAGLAVGRGVSGALLEQPR